MPSPFSLLALGLAAASPALAATAGSIIQAGDTKVSAMMMFVGNNEKVYILDKAEGNAEQVNGHPAWGAVWDINSRQATVMDVTTNVFCASGMHLPNGSFVTFGGNGAITVGGNIGSQLNPDGVSAAFDTTYQDYDGRKAIRILNPCTSSDDFNSPNCQWFDNPQVLSMQKNRWYSAAEPLGDGRIAIIGGFVNGGYVNRNWPNTDPETEGGAAEPTYEFYPANGETAQVMQFMIDTSGLNSYAHTFLLKSGKMFVQANISTMIWEPQTNTETRLPDMPNGIARVYPASGATAMLPLTPANDYNPTILFCGGSDLPDEAWGNYSWPFVNTWEHPASADCHRITPEPEDGSQPNYVQDDNMLEGRTMGQFIILPTGKLLVVNGGKNGTAGYADRTLLTTSYANMPFGMSLASDPALTPAEYDPSAPSGKRWSNSGFQTSTFPRLYHSSAILLPDASVMIAGGNPNVDVNLTTVFPTTYEAEIFYPSYFSASTRPQPSGIPSKLSYGGSFFDITIPASSYSGSANDAADNTHVAVIRPGWTTHGMNMGQRYLQLNNTYTVNSDGSITLHTSQMPPNSNIFQPGPAMVFVVVNGIPSNATFVIVGSGNIETQPTSDAAALPANVRLDTASGSANGSSTGQGSDNGASHTGAIIGGVVGAVVILGIIGALVGICLSRRRRAANRQNGDQNPPGMNSYAMSNAPSGSNVTRGPGMGHGSSAYGGYGAGAAAAAGVGGVGREEMRGLRSSDSSAFVPVEQGYNPYAASGANASREWGASSTSLVQPPHMQEPYRDSPQPHFYPTRENGMSMDGLDPYSADSRMRTGTPDGVRRGY